MNFKSLFKNIKLMTISNVPVIFTPFFYWFILLAIPLAAFTQSVEDMWIFAGLTVATYTSVLFHEFGHVRSARKRGIGTAAVLMFPFGGVSLLKEMPRGKKEMAVMFAGPLTSFFIALGSLIAHLGLNALGYGTFSMVFYAIMAINTVLCVFNLIPAFPTDGGRLLRAFLYQYCKMSYVRSTRISMIVGSVFYVAFLYAGIVYRLPALAALSVLLPLVSMMEYKSIVKSEKKVQEN